MSTTIAVTLTIAQAEATSASNLTVADTAANIAQGIVADPSLLRQVVSFNMSAAGTITATQAQKLSSLGTTFHRGGFALTLSDTLANVTAAANAAGLAVATNVQVADAAYILLNAAATSFAHVNSVLVTGAPILTAAQLTKLESLPKFGVAAGASVTLSDTVSAISTALAAHAGWFTPLATISVHLDGSTIGAYTAGLLETMITNGKHVAFVPAGKNTTLNITAAAHDIAASAAALNGLATHVPLAFTVTNPSGTVSAADASALTTLSGFATHLATLAVSDNAANIDANYAALTSGGFQSVNVTSGTLYGTRQQLLSPTLHLQGTATATLVANALTNAATAESLSKLAGFALGAGVTLIMQDSYANIVASANAGAYAVTNYFSVVDTGANIVTASAHDWGGVKINYQLTGVATLTAAQLNVLANLSNFYTNGYALNLADTVANVLGISSDVRADATAIAITDVSGNVTTSALNILQGVASTLIPISIMLTDTGHVRVTAATYSADTAVIDDITYAQTKILTQQIHPLQSPLGAGAVTVTGNTAAILNIAAVLDGDWHVGNAAVTDTAANLTANNFDALHDDLAVPLTITLTDPLDTITVTSATYFRDTAQVDALQNAASLVVTGAAADLAPLAAGLATDYRVTTVSLTDSAANFDSLAATLAPLASKLSVTLTSGGTVGPATLALLASAHYSLNGQLVLSGTAAGVTGLTPRALAIAQSITISDVSTSFTAKMLDAIESISNFPITAITLTDTGLVGVGAATYAADKSIIDLITNSGAVVVTDSIASLTPILTSLENDSTVSRIVASDTAANIVASIANLLNVGVKLSVSLTDRTPITAGLVPQLALLPVANAAQMVIADTGANIAAVAEAATSATLSFLTAATVQLSVNSIVVAADAKALEALPNFSNAGHTLVIWDTVAHLTSGLYTATIANSDISALYLQTNGSPVSLSAATMLTMLALPHFHDTNPDGSSNRITISDTAAHLTAAFATLQADAAQLGNVSFVVNAGATVSEAMLSQLQTLGATAAPGVQLTVRDTAAAINADLQAQAQQITLPSIAASAYALSGNGTVTLPTAALLGLQPNFSAGPYTLTVSQTMNQTITIGGANDLGNLGSALVLTGGGHLSVAGNLAQLAALNQGAIALVTSNITDTLADILSPTTGLTAASPLLDGMLTITDAENITAAQAQSFFGLIQATPATLPTTGIAAANVSFGTNVETVTGSISALGTLTSLAAWSQNSTLTAAFSLTAADTVANLITPDEVNFLAGLKATELSGPSTTDAASAEKLFGLETKIHYQQDGYALTVQDTAANLLNLNNADGLGLATTITLAGNDTTTAAGAETLLANPAFLLNHVLTITDTPQNLLDPALAKLMSTGNYGSNLVLELNTPTTTDASTAAALVKLAGFTDPTHDLTISDHPSFLIDPTYFAAELLATSVTIPGDETVSAATILRLSQVPNFTPGANHLVLAANDVVDDPTLTVIADLGTSYNPNGHSITMTQDDTTLTQAEYNALQNDNVVTNGHLLSVTQPALTFNSEVEQGTLLQVFLNTSGQGTIRGYDQNGSSINTTYTTSPIQNIVSATVSDSPGNFSFTNTIDNAVSNPVIVLELASLTNAAGGTAFSTVETAGAFAFSASSGGPTDYLSIYNSAAVPAHTAPVLVYDPTAHTLSLAAQSTTVLVNLGGTVFPTSLTASELGVKHFVG